MTGPVPGQQPGAGSRAVPTVPAGSQVAGSQAAGSPSGSVSLFDVDPDAVAARVLACPAVAGLSAGPFGGAVTYLPGRRVAGVRLSPTAVEVHVVARYGPSVAELAGQVRAALAGHVGGRQVDLVVEEMADPRADALASTSAAPAASTPVLEGPAASGAAGPGRGAPAAGPAGTPPAASPRLEPEPDSPADPARSTRLFRRPSP